MKKLAVIDGKSVFYRGYYAMPNLSTMDGTPTGGVFGFASLAIELIKKLEPDYVTVAWDKPKTNIRKRREIYPEYKAGRKKAPDDFYEQIPILHELLDAFGWPLYEIDDYEADDIMATFAREAEEKGVETYLLTSDLDALQLISPHTKVFALKNGLSNLEEFDVEYFEKKYGIKVEQFLDFKSLKGDSSDNLPGVPGVGDKTAASLLQEFGTLENIYDNLDKIKPSIAKRLETGKDDAFLTKAVARLWTDVPVNLDWGVADVNDCDLDKVAEILRKLEFNSLIRRLPKHMQSDHGQTSLNLTGEDAPALEMKKVDWPNSSEIGSEAILHLEAGELWLLFDDEKFSHKPVGEVSHEFWQLLGSSVKVVSYDIKALYHQLFEHGVEVHFESIHDVRQGAFLVNPLMRDRSLESLYGQAMSDSMQTLAALKQVYSQQVAALEKNPALKSIADDYDFPLTYTLFKMENRGIKIDSDFLSEMSKELGSEHAKVEKEMFELAGHEFNIGSPSQLSEVLFTKLQLPTQGIKRGKTGYSTGQKELDKLRGQHPIIELIEKSRELAKLKNTYVDTLPKLADKGGRVHTTFNQDVASTGRLSSTNPNLQNIPIRTELGRRIRHAFIAEKGNVLISADYSQFELRLAAVLANDRPLIDDFNSGIDVHSKTASDVYKVPLEAVTNSQRRAAKVINFGVLYGMSPHGLSAAAGMTFADAKRFIDEYFRLRAPIRQFIDSTLKKASEEGYVETYYGRRRPTPDVSSSNFVVREAAKRAAANLPIQGTEADLMKKAMLRVEERLAGLGEQILQIHDSILVEAPKENTAKIAEILRDTMEGVAPELKIKLKVDIATGKNWGEL